MPIFKRPAPKSKPDLSGQSLPTPDASMSSQAVFQADEASMHSKMSVALLVLGVLFLLGAGWLAYNMVSGYLKAQSHYNDMIAVAGLQPDISQLTPQDGFDLETLSLNWTALQEINPDIIAWIIVPGTSINYPIVQGKDNKYYLDHLFDADSSGNGTIFLDYEGKASMDARNNIVYGHNMMDGSMFNDLLQFKDQGFFDQHRTVYLATPAMRLRLVTLATLRVHQDEPLRNLTINSQAALVSYLEGFLPEALTTAEGLSLQDLGVEQLYSFVTCDSDLSYRIALVCTPQRVLLESELRK